MASDKQKKKMLGASTISSNPMKTQLRYANRLRTLGLPTLEYRRERSDMIQVYKIVNNINKASNTMTRGYSKKAV